MIARDDGTWLLKAGGGRGVRSDDGALVLVTIGLLPPEHDPRFAVRLGEGTAPIVFTPREADELKEAVMYACESRPRYLGTADRNRREAARGLLGDAVLNRSQWDMIRRGLADDDDDEVRERALAALRSGAPSAWTHKGGDR